MVVVQSVPSTSKAPRKNRRTLSKKKPPRVVGDDALDQEHETSKVPPNATERSQDEEILIDVDGADIAPPTEAPSFGPAPASAGKTSLRSETRRVAIPPHRMSPLRRDWINIFGPLTEILGLQVRMNVQRKCVEIRVRLTAFITSPRLELIGVHRPQNTQKNSVHYKRGLILLRHMLLVSM
jgi:RNA-binding protein PNO1